MKKSVKLHWLKGRSKGGYVTFGVPWKKGERTGEVSYFPHVPDGSTVMWQEKPLAYYSDGSVKWSSYTAKIDADSLELRNYGCEAEYGGNEIEETDSKITVNNGAFTAVFPKSGTVVMKTPYANAALKVIKERRLEENGVEISKAIPYAGEIAAAEVEDGGALKTVIKVTGEHKSADGDEFLRFVVRFTIHYEEKSIQVMHTFLFDGDESVDFIKGVGLELTRKMEGELYNRRIKITGDYGVLHEPMQILNLWRPRTGPSIGFQPTLTDQLSGTPVDISKLFDYRSGNPVKKSDIDNVTQWDSYRIQQTSADSFIVKKRTAKPQCAYIKANWGKRSKGLMYIADEKTGLAVAMRNFWQKYPSSLYAEGLTKDTAKLTAWIMPPDAEAIDMRHYDTVAHDQTYYEGFPEIGACAYGIANTNEMTIFMFDDIPSDDNIMALAERVQKPPVLVADPEYYHEVKALGTWALVDRSTPLKTWFEDELDKAFDFYKNEVEQRHWYGLWDYGDFMHTYDAQRHCWKYDLGGYAWQNTELVPTLWLWYSFLRTGREDIFTVAEAMSRHTSEVDTYHFGDLKGLGSRHNVVHWGDACKEPRIGMAGHHRAMYYLLGGDPRIGDVFDDVKDADFATLKKDPLRYAYMGKEKKMPTHARSGPDWSTYCSNWFTQWETKRDEYYKSKLIVGLSDIKKSPMRLISGSNYEYDPASGHLGYIGESAAGGSHLAVCMGGPQTWMEIADDFDDAELRDMLREYGEFYYMSPEDKVKASKGIINPGGFEYPYMASTLAAYAAKEKSNDRLAYKTWQVLIYSLTNKTRVDNFDADKVKNYFNTKSLNELFWISTNFTAQWCMNTIVVLDLIGDKMLDKESDYEWADWVRYSSVTNVKQMKKPDDK